MTQIYTLEHPITGKIRYVGKTISTLKFRLEKHIDNRNFSKSPVSKWVKSLYLQGLKPIIRIVDEVEDENWQCIEIYWIEQFRQWGFQLLNISIGGDGSSGYRHTDKAKELISVANSRPKSKEWIDKVALEMTKTVSTPIIQLCMNGDYVREWASFCYAAKEINPNNYTAAIKNIHSCCNNKRRSAYKYRWSYKNTEMRDKELAL